MAEGVGFLIPSLLFMKGALIDNQRSSNKFATSGNRSALTLAGLVPSAGLSAGPAHAAGSTLRQRGAFHAGCYAQCTLTQRAFLQMFYPIIEICICRKLMPDMAEGRGSVGDISFYSKDCRTE